MVKLKNKESNILKGGKCMNLTMSPRATALAIMAFFLMLITVSFFMWWRQASVWQDQVINEHITQLHDIFMRIDADCHILNFEHQKNYIDFLNVVKFVGSEVGSMHVEYPDKWNGPYLQDNPTMQEKQYQIVRTQKGYYIVPGEGVELSNGKIIGKDIMFDEKADIDAMLKDPQALQCNEYVLAAHMPLNKHRPTQEVQVLVEDVEAE